MDQQKPLFRMGKSIILIIIIFILEIVMMMFALAITALFFKSTNAWVLAHFLTNLSVLVIVWFYLYKLENEPYTAMGFVRPEKNPLHLVWQIPLGALVTITIPQLIARSQGESAYAALEENFLPLSEVFLPILVLGLISMGFITSIVSEFQKRKLTNDILRRKFSVPVAIVLNTLFWLLFWPTHAPIVYILFVGLIANVLYFHYKSLWPPIIFSGVMALLEITGGVFLIANLLG